VNARAAEIVRLMRIYMPPAQAQQLLGDLMRSKAADVEPALRAVFVEAFQYGQGSIGEQAREATP